MAEYTSIAPQTVDAAGAIVFTDMTVAGGCRILHREDTGVFSLLGGGTCPCKGRVVKVTFGANISVPTGQTPAPISVALALDGEIDRTTVMTVTPAAVEEPFNVARTISVVVPNATGVNVSVRNASTIPITVANATIDLVG